MGPIKSYLWPFLSLSLLAMGQEGFKEQVNADIKLLELEGRDQKAISTISPNDIDATTENKGREEYRQKRPLEQRDQAISPSGINRTNNGPMAQERAVESKGHGGYRQQRPLEQRDQAISPNGINGANNGPRAQETAVEKKGHRLRLKKTTITIWPAQKTAIDNNGHGEYGKKGTFEQEASSLAIEKERETLGPRPPDQALPEGLEKARDEKKASSPPSHQKSKEDPGQLIGGSAPIYQ